MLVIAICLIKHRHATIVCADFDKISSVFRKYTDFTRKQEMAIKRKTAEKY
jgi:hypothetical protein